MTEFLVPCADPARAGVTKQEAKTAVVYALCMTAHLGRRDWARKALTAFDEYCKLDPVQVPNHGRTVCLHCGKHYEEVHT